MYKSNNECDGILSYIFKDAHKLYNELAPKGLGNSEYVLFFHPSPNQQYEEHLRMSENIRKLTKKADSENEYVKVEDFEQDSLLGINEFQEFAYILGLSVYDIFSNNHEVIADDNKIFELGSMRGSGRFIAGFLNDYLPENRGKYDYIDFYMGTIWIKERGNLTPFYEYIFKKLKDLACDWRYSFPRMYLANFSDNSNESTSNLSQEHYNPEIAPQRELESTEKNQIVIKFQNELDEIYENQLEEAKYKPLNQLVKAYKNIYGCLPIGHPQKEFE